MRRVASTHARRWCCLLLIGAGFGPQPRAAAADAGSSDTQLLYVEASRQRTFGPQKPTPAGTTFYVKVLSRVAQDTLRLHRCDVPCKTATPVKVWPATQYSVGDELSWRADQEGTYYFWNQNARDGRSREASFHEFVGTRVRITFDSGTVIEAWYVLR